MIELHKCCTHEVRLNVLDSLHNSREKARAAVLIIKMQGNNTYIADPGAPGEEPRKFAFDFSYWSHDGFKELDDGYLASAEPQYADQVRQLAHLLLWFITACQSAQLV